MAEITKENPTATQPLDDAQMSQVDGGGSALGGGWNTEAKAPFAEPPAKDPAKPTPIPSSPANII